MILFHSGWKWHQEITSPKPCLEQGQLWGQIRLLGVLCSHILKASTHTDFKISLCKMFACLSLWGKSYLLLQSDSLPSKYASCILFFSCAPLWRAYLWLFHNLLVGAVRLPLGHLEAVSSPRPNLLAFPHQAGTSSTQLPLWHFTECAPVCQSKIRCVVIVNCTILDAV